MTMSDEDSSNSDDFGGISGRDCHGLYGLHKIKCANCFDLDCARSVINKELSFDALASELV